MARMSGPLEYERADRATTPLRVSRLRPDRITSIGTLSILFGVVGILTAIGWGTWSIWIYRQSIIVPPGLQINPPPRTGNIQPEIKNRFIRRLLELQPINVSRQELLDALLENAATLRGDLSPVIDHGRLPSTTGDKPQYFELRSGRIELYDTHAIFRAAGDNTVRVTEEDIVTRRHASGLTPADIKVLMNAVREKGGDGLTTAQEQAVRSLLSAGTQKLIATDQPLAGQIRSLELDGEDATLHTANGAWVTLKKDGTMSRSGKSSPANARGVPRTALYGACAASGIHLILSTLLVVLGIATLRQKLWVRRWLFAYAAMKLAVSIVGWAMLAWVWTSFTGGWSSDGTTFTLLSVWALAVIFPIGLIGLLNRRLVCEYYLKFDPFEA